MVRKIFRPKEKEKRTENKRFFCPKIFIVLREKKRVKKVVWSTFLAKKKNCFVTCLYLFYIRGFFL